MSWKVKFRILEGWFTDKPAFASEADALEYAEAIARAKLGIVDFDVVPRQRAPDSCVVRYAA